MNFRWLFGTEIERLTYASTDSAIWRGDYKNWIAESPVERSKFLEFPVFTIITCPKMSCGYAEEIKENFSAAGVRSPCHGMNVNFVRFGEHEREIVENAVTCWQREKKRPRTAA